MREIIKRVEKLLERSGYNYCDYFGCFDIAAKKGKKVVLLKILNNVDSIKEEQANSLKTIATNLEATALIAGDRTRRERLEEEVIYHRFDIPTVSTSALGNFFMEEAKPLITRARGGLFAEIDARLLRKKRQASGMTQNELARKVGTTKKTIYEHERANKKAPLGLVEAVEKLLGPVSTPLSFEPAKESTESMPRGRFELSVSRHFRSMGFETASVYRAPFNIIAKNQEMLILSEAEERAEKLERMVEDMVNFSRLARRPLIAVTKEEAELEIPTIKERDLRDCSMKDIRNIIRNR